MDMNLAVAVAGVSLTAIGLILPGWISRRSAEKKEFREAARPVLEKLLVEIDLMSDGTYPYRTITKTDMNKLLPRTPKGRKEALKNAYDLYVEAHQSTAKTKHWHDESPSGGVFFPASFIVTNPDDVIKQMEPFKKQLSR
ncbi:MULTISPECIES: hypothetical protein [unclassified Serratia (in: enterobacteria)]|uniref:hypothetical protein n=1 Tax=unclassified Serratia (in: enterobacteria) TaxID=2647522 RepID=UPI00046A5377|nr:MULTISPECIES: hypothetical protein [unclassified Serratia (in: enterobacteria)]